MSLMWVLAALQVALRNGALSFREYYRAEIDPLARDPLTMVWNRPHFERRRKATDRYALILIDIDNFKKINDSFGHHAGDVVLRAVASALRTNAGDRVFRVADSATGGMSVLFMARGVGSIIGSFSTGLWAKNDERRMRRGIFWAFLIAGASYVVLSGAPTLAIAAIAVMAGHAGSSQAWVFSTTMLQRTTADRFRGRVFSADFAGLFVVMAGVSYVASHLIDGGVDVRRIALATGLVSLIPAVLWWRAQRLWSSDRTPPQGAGAQDG